MKYIIPIPTKKEEIIAKKEEIIKVIGLGGGGSNAVNYMAKKYPSKNVCHICANTDSRHLNSLENVDERINLGKNSLGAGMKTHVGEQAAQESEADIRKAIDSADMLFLAAGMGGGTGTGAISVVAEIAKSMNILTVAIVTKPSAGEGEKKMNIANDGIEKLTKHVNSLIILPNDRLVDTLSTNCFDDISKAFAASYDVLANSVHSITDIISKIGYINVDFRDIETAMSIPGKAMISSGEAKGKNRAEAAVKAALSNPLIEQTKIHNAKGVLVNMTSSTIGMGEKTDVEMIMEDYSHKDADIKIGIVQDKNLKDSLKVTVILTGLEQVNQHGENQPSILDPSVEVMTEQGGKIEPLLANNQVPSDVDEKRIPAYLRNKQKA